MKRIICFVMAVVMALLPMPESITADGQEFAEIEVFDLSSGSGFSNSESGISSVCSIEETGMDSWWPDSSTGKIKLDSSWFMFQTRNISDLRPGDVILWRDDEMQMWVNHLAITVYVDPAGAYYTTADGNQYTETGVNFVTRWNLNKSGSTFGEVIVWRNTVSGDRIAAWAETVTNEVINSNDHSFADRWGHFGWCYCYAVALLATVPEVSDSTQTDPVGSEALPGSSSPVSGGIWNGMDNGIVYGVGAGDRIRSDGSVINDTSAGFNDISASLDDMQSDFIFTETDPISEEELSEFRVKGPYGKGTLFVVMLDVENSLSPQSDRESSNSPIVDFITFSNEGSAESHYGKKSEILGYMITDEHGNGYAAWRSVLPEGLYSVRSGRYYYNTSWLIDHVEAPGDAEIHEMYSISDSYLSKLPAR